MMSVSQFRIAAALAALAGVAGAQSADIAPAADLVGSTVGVRTIVQPPIGGSYSAVLHDNGGFVTDPGAGFGGADVSVIEAPSTTLGFTQSATFRLADDFTVPAGDTWNLASMKRYGYQTNSGTTSTLTGAFVQIWSGAGGPAAGAVVIAGDLVTNRMTGTSWTGAYRATTTTLSSIARPIMVADIDMTWAPALPAGTYWVDVALTGSTTSGPFCPPVTPRPLAGLNAQQGVTSTATWTTLVEGPVGNQVNSEIPFILEGTSCNGPIAAANSTPGSLIPAVGTGGTGSTWPGTLPADPTTLSVSVGCPIDCIDSIVLDNPTHTWSGDTMFVLEDPSGTVHNLLCRPGFTGAGFGNSGDFTGGQIVLVDPSTLGAATIPTTGAIAAGTYKQSFGAGPAAGTVNTPLRLISGAAGTWTLKVYDWAGGDSGAIDGFTINANTCDYNTSTYCVAKVNSLGCTPAIAGTGSPSATSGSGFVVSASNIRNNKNGLLFYSNNGPSAAPFQGGTLCVNPPIRRTGVQNSFGSGPATQDCSGTFAIDMNTYASTASAPFLTTVGSVINCQFWSRDPGFAAPDNTSLTDGLQYYVGS